MTKFADLPLATQAIRAANEFDKKFFRVSASLILIISAIYFLVAASIKSGGGKRGERVTRNA